MDLAVVAEHAKLAEQIPLDRIDVSDPALYQQDVWRPYFRRLRRDAPVHYCPESPVGPYWSVTKHKDIIDVEVRHRVFSSSSTLGGIVLRDRTGDLELPMFIAMDPPKHEAQRKVVQPIVSPETLDHLKDLIRSRIGRTLDSLPVGEPFDWVDRVSVELTAQMLATLFDFPFEDRRKLSFWSDVSTAIPYAGALVESEEQREQYFRECLGYFMRLWNERVNAEPRPDLISMLAHGEATRAMSPREYLGNVLLLIVGGNDTTRNSMSGGVLFLSENRDEFAKLRARPELVDSMVPEIIRYQTPIAYMRRTALEDSEIGGQTIRKGRVAVTALAIDLGAAALVDGIVAGQEDGPIGDPMIEDEAGQDCEGESGPTTLGEDAVEAGGIAVGQAGGRAEQVGDGAASGGQDGGEEQDEKALVGGMVEDRGE